MIKSFKRSVKRKQRTQQTAGKLQCCRMKLRAGFGDTSLSGMHKAPYSNANISVLQEK